MVAAEHPERLHSYSQPSTLSASQRYLTRDVGASNYFMRPFQITAILIPILVV